ncbi:MAG TPA: LysR family transcriptional regulator [Clostridiales bacterium]|nr:LysR family transcriptional regulator [Clostridiales bacterium]
MNLVYLKYAVEVASLGSINKAAEKLYIDQPNLSRSIRDLENSLGVTIFERSARGMKLTADGEVFLKYAKSILGQVDALETVFREGAVHKKQFSVSVPRASYISEAFAAFSKKVSEIDSAELFYKETNSMRTIRNVLEEKYKLGILRYAENFDKYYKEMMEEKGLACELIGEFHYVLLMSRESPLAALPEITYRDLAPHIEIAHADPYVPSLPLSEVKKEELPEVEKRIFVFERGSQFDLLAENPDTFMWVSPVPKVYLERYGLVQRVCPENRKIYKDLMIYRGDYKLTELDKAFVSELCRVKREAMS